MIIKMVKQRSSKDENFCSVSDFLLIKIKNVWNKLTIIDTNKVIVL